MSLLLSMVWALLLTLVLELSFALAWGLRKQQLSIVLLMNVLTNPAANILYSFMTAYMGLPKLPLAIVLEFAAIAIEGLCCKGIIKKPWLFAVLINLFSYTAGLILQLF